MYKSKVVDSLQQFSAAHPNPHKVGIKLGGRLQLWLVNDIGSNLDCQSLKIYKGFNDVNIALGADGKKHANSRVADAANYISADVFQAINMYTFVYGMETYLNRQMTDAEYIGFFNDQLKQSPNIVPLDCALRFASSMFGGKFSPLELPVVDAELLKESVRFYGVNRAKLPQGLSYMVAMVTQWLRNKTPGVELAVHVSIRLENRVRDFKELAIKAKIYPD